MVLPQHVVRAARDGDIAVVEAYLAEAEPGAVNDRNLTGTTLLMSCVSASIKERHVQCARRLIARGADVNLGSHSGSFPLHYASFPGDCSSTMVSLLLDSGARVNARTEDEDLTPLGQLIEEFDYDLEDVEEEDEIAARQRQISRKRSWFSCHTD